MSQGDETWGRLSRNDVVSDGQMENGGVAAHKPGGPPSFYQIFHY